MGETRLSKVNLLDEVEDIAKTHPDAIAIYSPRRKITYAQLISGMWSAAANLASCGIRAGDRVGVGIENKLDHLFVSLALARMGASHFAFQVGSTSKDLGQLAMRLDLQAMILDRDLEAGVCRKILLKDFQQKSIQASERDKLRSNDGALGWLILNSSGTTGAPKYAILTHEQTQVRALQSREHFGYSLGMKIWCSPDISYTMTKIRSMTSLKAGVASCLIASRTSYDVIVEFLNSVKVDFGYITSFDLHALINLGVPMPSLRAMEATSGIVSPRSSNRFTQTVSANLQIAYATNEAGSISWNEGSFENTREYVVGKAAPYMSVQVVDQSDTQVEPGVIGRVRVKGPGVVHRYISNPEANIAAFKSGWFYPGDLGSLNAAGELSFHGRVDDMMIFNGINIYPAEIEDALSTHAAIEDCCVFALRHEAHQDIPLAAVVTNKSITETELLEHCWKVLGPNSLTRIIFLDSIPRTANGKALRRDLVALAKKEFEPTKDGEPES